MAASAAMSPDIPLRYPQILHFEFDRPIPVEFVNRRLRCQFDRRARRESAGQRRLPEGDALQAFLSMPDHQLKMLAGFADHARRGGDLHVAETKQRLPVAMPE